MADNLDEIADNIEHLADELIDMNKKKRINLKY